MQRIEVIDLIAKIVSEDQAFEKLEKRLQDISNDGLSDTLLHCGIIPEVFEQNSSEEKLWAKYCDILLALTLTRLGIKATVLRIRGDSADVQGQTDQYSIVGDAKAFRLSRTAKNQKDFKISALDDWRRADTYACLIAPLYQFPSRNSQIYRQAKEKNVTLLSYVHMKYLLDFKAHDSLAPLWQTAGLLAHDKDAVAYWQAIDRTILQLTSTTAEQLKAYKLQEVEQTQRIGQDSISYWQRVIDSYRALSKD